ncbi:hypothetical protein ACFLSX_04335, partial [Calditrichota bacterium]
MINRILFTWIIFYSYLYLTGCEQNGIFNPSDNLEKVPIISFFIDHDAYLNLLANKTENYFVPANIFYQGLDYQGDIRASGAGSRFDSRWSYRVRLNEEHSIENLNAFNLSAQVYDHTMLNTTIVSHLYWQ